MQQKIDEFAVKCYVKVSCCKNCIYHANDFEIGKNGNIVGLKQIKCLVNDGKAVEEDGYCPSFIEYSDCYSIGDNE
jgi:hypothetical protein